jgi:hypothetical protein
MNGEFRNDDRPGPRLAPLCAPRGRAPSVPAVEEVSPDRARIAEGWERRFVADRMRVDEVVQVYRELGFEVVADPVASESLESYCRDCRLLVQCDYRAIYTRKRPPTPLAGTGAAGAGEKGIAE